MYEDLARAVLLEDDPAVVRRIARIRSRHPGISEAELSGKLVERAAWRCAAVGAATCGAVSLLDQYVAAPDLTYQALSLNRLAASVTLARRRSTTMVERGLVAAGSLLVAGASDLLRRATARAARRALRDPVPRLVPAVSALAGGAIAYGAAKIFARAVDEILTDPGRRRRRAR